MADWLALHGLDVATCRARLVQIKMTAAKPAPDPDMDPATVQKAVFDALILALPAGQRVLDRIRTEARIDLAPDPVRFARAFTLHDDGRGLPFVSCPLKGRISDLLLLGHEIGHACQSLASDRADLPPVQRETAAYLAEQLICAAAGPLVRAVHRARTGRIIARDGAALSLALDAANAPYHYNWNYPLARDLAARAVAHLNADAQWGVFTGSIDMPQLLRLGPA